MNPEKKFYATDYEITTPYFKNDVPPYKPYTK